MEHYCYYTYFTYPEVNGGAPLYTHNIASFFLNEGKKITVLGRRRRGKGTLSLISPTFQVIQNGNLKFHYGRYSRIIDKNFSYSLATCHSLSSICRNSQLLHVISHALFTPNALLIKQKYKIPVITSVIEDVFTDNHNTFLSRMYFKQQQLYLRFTIIYSDQVIFHSEAIYNTILKMFPNYAWKLNYFPQTLDPITYQKLASIPLKENKNKTILLYAGSLVEGKNVHLLIHAIHQVHLSHDVELYILGEGHLKPYLKSLAKKLNLSSKVKFIGEVKHDDIVKYYSMADIFVHPSKAEGAHPPFSVLEYLTTGKPVIMSTACDPLRKFNACTLQFNPNDLDTLISYILQLINDNGLAEKLKSNLHTCLRPYLPQYFYGHLKSVYNKAFYSQK